MYRVIRVDTNETVAMTTRKEDAESFFNNLDNVAYRIEHDDFVNKKVDTAKE